MKLLVSTLLVLSVAAAEFAQGSVLSSEPAESLLTVQLGGLPTITVLHDDAGTASLVGGWRPYLVVESGVWSTTGASPGTSLFTGVPIISNLILSGPFINPAVSVSLETTAPNPVGPGSLGPLVGFGAPTGDLKVIAGGGLSFLIPLEKAGAANVATTQVMLGTLATVDVTFGPWVTADIVITDITTNVIKLPTRSGSPTGVGITLVPGAGEQIKTFLNTAWTTTGGFHPPFSFVTSWRDWTVSQTVSGVPGTHTENAILPLNILKRLHTVTITDGGVDPTGLMSGTGTVTLVTPMRIDTSDKLFNAIPAVMRMKFRFLADGDGDGDPDESDNCPLVANPGQENNDGDAAGDACDDDDDNDGLLDTVETNTGTYVSSSDTGTDPKDDDTDDDGLLDGAEVALGTDPNDEDSDADGVCDGPSQVGSCTSAGDTCPLVNGGSQTNSDSHFAGDICQCGDVNDDGIVNATDLLRVREKVVGRTLTGPLVAVRCNVIGPSDGGDTDCTLGDAFIIERMAGGGAVTGENVCDAFLDP